MKPSNSSWRGLSHIARQPAVQILITILVCLGVLIFAWSVKTHPLQNRPKITVGLGAPTATADLTTSKAALPDSAAVSDAMANAAVALGSGIPRLPLLHTKKQDYSAFDVRQYTVKEGDTIFDIASRFGIKPSTILWGNLTRLADNPEMIHPGQTLDILPVDGVYYQWQKGDGLNGVAKGLGVKPEDIVNFPGNHLDEKTIGDYSHPNIPVGTMVIVPNGYRNFITWSAPTISRFNPGVARLYGPGACDKPSDGAVGTGTFVMPTVRHWLSGYDYTPEANHSAVDFAGSMGVAIYAADNGVVVYAGWNDRGYGNVTVIDHGNGWQTLYGHQSDIKVSCGQSVLKGALIGLMGSTGRSSGPHLHFEVWYNSAHVNPHTILDIEGK